MSQNGDLYSLLWNNHLRNLKGAFEMFREDTALVDVTLSCEGKQLKAHKIVLSACSLYFLELFRDNPCPHPIVILRDVKYQNMMDLLTFMYMGEVNVSMDHIKSFLKTAEFLQVKGLMEDKSEKGEIQHLLNHNNDEEDRTMEPEIITETKEEECEILDEKYNGKKEEPVDMHLEEGDQSVKSETDDIEVVDNTMFEFIGTNTSDTNLSVEPNEVPYFSNEIIDDNQRPITKHICHICGKGFSHIISLKLHLPKHSGVTRCMFCKVVLSRKYDLKVHMLKKHKVILKNSRLMSSIPIFVRQAKEMKKTKYTKRKVSSRNKLFHCTVCDKKFLNRDSVYKHMQSHEGRTKCPICHKILSRRSHVLRHIASKHGQTDN